MNQRGKKRNELKEMRTILETSRTIIKGHNIRIIGVPEETDKKKGHEKTLEIIVENVPKMAKKIAS